MNSIIFKQSLLIITSALLLTNTVQAMTLDEIIEAIGSNQNFDPLVVGKAKAKKNPMYDELMALAERYNVKIKWVPSVAKEVLKFPPHPKRMFVKPTDIFDGWFDEYVIPNQIIMSSKAAFMILIHELRHAIHLGSHGQTEGSWFDQEIQKSKKFVSEKYLEIDASKLSPARKKKLKGYFTRLVETASEISAHQGDVYLSKKFEDEELADAYQEFISEYEVEFKNNLDLIQKAKLPGSEQFVGDLSIKLKKFMKEKELKITVL